MSATHLTIPLNGKDVGAGGEGKCLQEISGSAIKYLVTSPSTSLCLYLQLCSCEVCGRHLNCELDRAVIFDTQDKVRDSCSGGATGLQAVVHSGGLWRPK